MNKKTLKTIQGIQKELYDKYKAKLHKREYTAPDLRQHVINLAKDESYPEYQRQRYQNMVDSGVYDAKQDTIDEKVAKEYEKEIEKAIDEAIKDGRLPKPKTPAWYTKLINKTKKHAKKDIRKQSTKRRLEAKSKTGSKTGTGK